MLVIPLGGFYPMVKTEQVLCDVLVVAGTAALTEPLKLLGDT